MVAIVQRYTNALASGLIPLLSRLSAGTEMASYGNAQWEFLLGSDEVTTFVAVDDVDVDVDDTTNTQLLGCLLRIDMEKLPAPENNDKTIHAVTTAETNPVESTSSAAGFGMMLVSPAARGRGLAKLLLNEAISEEDKRRKRGLDGASSKELPPRKLLAVCTNLGQPVYRRLGFSDVGRVTALTTSIRSATAIGDTSLEPPGGDVRIYGSLDRSTDEINTIDPEIVNLVAAMDATATGWDRSGRLNKLLVQSSESNLRSIAAVALHRNHNAPMAAAVLRQEGPGCPFVIGPMMGSEASALSLVSALAAAVPENEKESKISILVSEHPQLVDRLKDAGFRIGFEFPAMALDGRPIYENGDGSYMSLIHPTLG